MAGIAAKAKMSGSSGHPYLIVVQTIQATLAKAMNPNIARSQIGIGFDPSMPPILTAGASGREGR
jgi:hypothetical protein